MRFAYIRHIWECGDSLEIKAFCREDQERGTGMLRIIKENRRLRKENAELRKAIEEALQDLLDPECPPGVRILSTSIRLERALENKGREPQCRRD